MSDISKSFSVVIAKRMREEQHHDSSVMEIVQEAWRTRAQAARLLQLEEGVEQLPVLAEVVYKPVQGQCRETTAAQLGLHASAYERR